MLVDAVSPILRVNRVRCKVAAMLLLQALLLLGCAPAALPSRTVGMPARAVPQRMTVALCEDYPEESRSIEQARRDLDAMQRAGVNTLRVAFGWDAMEPRPGEYDFGFWDEFVAAADARGVRLIPYVCYTPRWNSEGNSSNFWRCPPRDYERFGAFVRALVGRYRGSIRSWELWNEPDNREYWEGSAAQFARLVKSGAGAVREVDPGATVVLGGIAWELDFLAELLREHAIADDVDVVNLHSYYETWSPEPLETLPAYVRRARDLVARYGDGEAIWLAEVGYSDYRQRAYVSPVYEARFAYEHTPAHQADALFRTMTLAASTGLVPLTAWYRVNDLPQAQDIIGDVNNRHLGLLDTARREKPAYRAITFFSQLCGDGLEPIDDTVRVTRRIRSHAHVHCFRRSDGSVVVVAWLQTNAGGLPMGAGDGDAGDAGDARVEEIDLNLPGRFRRVSARTPAGDTLDVHPPRVSRNRTWLKHIALSPQHTVVLHLQAQ